MPGIISVKLLSVTYRLVIRTAYEAEERSNDDGERLQLLFCHLHLARRRVISSKIMELKKLMKL
jgi:hypothetical protein